MVIHDTVYVLHRFIPVPIKGKVFTGIVMVMEKCTHGILVNNPTSDGWIESNIQSLTDWLLLAWCSYELEWKHSLQLIQSLYDPTPPPPYLYLHALSCYSALTQLYSHSGQLPTASYLHSWHRIKSQHCFFGCLDIPKDNHHLFVECPYFAELHFNSVSNVVKSQKSSVRICLKDVCYPLT